MVLRIRSKVENLTPAVGPCNDLSAVYTPKPFEILKLKPKESKFLNYTSFNLRQPARQTSPFSFS